MQSEWLVIGVIAGLSMTLGLRIFDVVGMQGPPPWFLWSSGFSVGFALLVWAMRAGTAGAAALGGVLCLSLLIRLQIGEPWTMTALPELITLFVLTFLATRFGRKRKEAMGTAEEKRGRRAAQVAANLGVAGIWAAYRGHPYLVTSLAALAEATADTVSSELGQVLGGRTFLITTGERVEAGTDGGMSVQGTLLGAVAAGVIALVAIALGAVDVSSGLIVFLAGSAGLLFDSLLGATLERRGWLGNDLVNFASTALAAWLAFEAAKVLAPPVPAW
ncbi:DUF92 domain-containing protein [Granulicella sibirica]|uniref:DUF92 domain-containing protein n=1 Tax=Granulicella sibirica TaxID=2479048 RepID=UPI001375C850|nr:DUF92 domain-containing protein [Granulicella sibirica]